MDLGVLPSFLERGSLPRRRWANHRIAVAEAQELMRSVYVTRIEQIILKAVALDVDVLQLPACALPDALLAEDSGIRSLLATLPALVSGTLKVGRSEDPFSWQAGSIILKDGRCESRNDESQPVTAELSRNLVACVAISSSIRKFEATRRIEALAAGRTLIALDLGHHQYHARYWRILRQVHSRSRQCQPRAAAVSLAYWRHRRSSATASWSIGLKLVTRQIVITRAIDKVADSRRASFEDYVDVLNTVS